MPIETLDPDAVEQALANYQHADAEHLKRKERDPLIMADALLAIKKERSQQLKTQRSGLLGASSSEDHIADLIVTGLDVIWTLLKR